MNEDCLLCIFNYVDFADILNCFPVCKQFNKVLNSNTHWKPLFMNHFGYLCIKIYKYDVDYKSKYMYWHSITKPLTQTRLGQEFYCQL